MLISKFLSKQNKWLKKSHPATIFFSKITMSHSIGSLGKFSRDHDFIRYFLVFSQKQNNVEIFTLNKRFNRFK